MKPLLWLTLKELLAWLRSVCLVHDEAITFKVRREKKNVFLKSILKLGGLSSKKKKKKERKKERETFYGFSIILCFTHADRANS